MNLAHLRGVFPWRMALLFALVPCLLFLFLGAWFAWGLQPLERYYLRAYWGSSEGTKQLGSTTQIEWLFKAAPGQKSEPAIDLDVTSGGMWNMSLELSSFACAQGWISLVKSHPEAVDSAQLQGLLEEDFYGSRSFRQVIAEPLLYASSVPLLVLYVAFMMKSGLRTEWNRLREEVSKAELTSHLGEIRGQFARRIWSWIKRRIEIERARLQGGYSTIKTVPRAALIPGMVRQAEAGPLTGEQQYLPSSHKELPQRRSIFPGAASVPHAQEPSKPWDESQWID